jgi:hypothetical protein
MTIPIEVTLPDDGAPQAAVGDVTDTAITELETVEADLPEVVAPDRADAPVSEITERFLKVVLAHVPLDRIEELHLFSPLRQGGVETGIAVIAARVRLVVVEQPSAPELPLETEVLEAAAVVEGVADEPAAAEAMMAEVDAGVDAEVDAGVDAGVDAEDLHADDVTVIETMPVPRIRHTVYTARYRLVQKGPERGKWEADVVAEAEAPLITVDLVVRGVQRRAGEESEIVRYSAPQLARAVRVPYPTV